MLKMNHTRWAANCKWIQISIRSANTVFGKKFSSIRNHFLVHLPIFLCLLYITFSACF